MPTDSPRDTYLDIARTLRVEIRALTEGQRLDTEATLCARFAVARNTLRKALGLLADEGVVHARPAKGWFAGPGPERPERDAVLVADDLEGLIRAEDPAPGAQLTTAPKIAKYYGVSLYAAREALTALASRGIVVAQHGKGWYVASGGR